MIQYMIQYMITVEDQNKDIWVLKFDPVTRNRDWIKVHKDLDVTSLILSMSEDEVLELMEVEAEGLEDLDGILEDGVLYKLDVDSMQYLAMELESRH